MPLELNMQINLVICSLIAGTITGILFDIYRGIRGLNPIKILTIVEDILFWILTSLIVFTFLLYANYAFLTPYVYVFIVIAILLYFKFVSRHFYSREKAIAKGLTKIIRILFKNICYPLRIITYKVTDKRK